MTSFGSKARMWTCESESHYLEPLFGSLELAEPSQYVEAHSNEAHKIRQAFDHMKRFPPVARRGVGLGQLSWAI